MRGLLARLGSGLPCFAFLIICFLAASRSRSLPSPQLGSTHRHTAYRGRHLALSAARSPLCFNLAKPAHLLPSQRRSMSGAPTPADGAAYWLRWQVFVCGALIVLPGAVAAVLLPRLRRRAAPLRATDLWVSCWARLHPGWLLGYRAFALAAAVALLVRLLVMHGFDVFYFYTQWTFLLVTIYFAFATAISAHGCWIYSKKGLRKADESHGFLNVDIENRDISTPVSEESKKDGTNKMVSYYEQIVNEKRAGFWGRCMQIIYQTSAGATMLTDVTFWGLLVPLFYRDKFGLALVTDGMHSLNAVFLIIDTILNNMPFPWYQIAFFVFWSCTYVTFQWLLHAFGGLTWWPYPFLDLSSSGAPLWYLGMAIAHIPCFFLYWLIVKAKHTYFPRMFSHAYARTS